MDAITRSYTTTFPQINHIREAEFQKHVQRILTGIDTLISIITLLHFMHATYIIITIIIIMECRVRIAN